MLTNTLGLNEVMLFFLFLVRRGGVALGNLDIENIPLFTCSVPAKSFGAILGTAGCFIERASIHQGVMLDKSMKPRGMEDWAPGASMKLKITSTLGQQCVCECVSVCEIGRAHV